MNESQQCSQIIAKIKSLRNPKNIEGMARFGISSTNTYGVPIPILRKMAREHKKNHPLALLLWDSKIHEARILASLVAEPAKLTSSQMDKWANDFDSWDVCDQCCSNLFSRSPLAYEKVQKWAKSDEEYVRRASFALIAALTVHDKKASNSQFLSLLPLIKNYSSDERNFVRKAVNWSLRQIGKRNLALNRAAILASKAIRSQNTKSAKWIANDALRELQSENVQKRLKEKEFTS